MGEPAGHRLGVLGVVPQVLGGRLVGELGDLGTLRVQVADVEDRVQDLAELAELYGKVDGHVC